MDIVEKPPSDFVPVKMVYFSQNKYFFAIFSLYLIIYY
jgi:hypothetical protein